jgi:hypothetical protein
MLGCVAVLVTLGYLAMQLRQAERNQRALMNQGVINRGSEDIAFSRTAARPGGDESRACRRNRVQRQRSGSTSSCDAQDHPRCAGCLRSTQGGSNGSGDVRQRAGGLALLRVSTRLSGLVESQSRLSCGRVCVICRHVDRIHSFYRYPTIKWHGSTPNWRRSNAKGTLRFRGLVFCATSVHPIRPDTLCRTLKPLSNPQLMQYVENLLAQPA